MTYKMQAQILNFPRSGYYAPPTIQRVDVDFVGILSKLAQANNLPDSMAMARVLANALYARNDITAADWRNIVAMFEPYSGERRLI